MIPQQKGFSVGKVGSPTVPSLKPTVSLPLKISVPFLYPPWKTNMSPENQWLEDVFPIEIVPF